MVDSLVPPSVDLGLLVLRLATGLVFLPHGWLKLNPNGPMKGPGGVAAWFKQLGIPLPGLLAWVVALLETAGALLLIVGIGTRLIALAMVVEMLVAILRVRIGVGKSSFMGAQAAGWEFEFVLMAAALTLAIAGGGSLALDPIVGLAR